MRKQSHVAKRRRSKKKAPQPNVKTFDHFPDPNAFEDGTIIHVADPAPIVFKRATHQHFVDHKQRISDAIASTKRLTPADQKTLKELNASLRKHWAPQQKTVSTTAITSPLELGTVMSIKQIANNLNLTMRRLRAAENRGVYTIKRSSRQSGQLVLNGLPKEIRDNFLST